MDPIIIAKNISINFKIYENLRSFKRQALKSLVGGAYLVDDEKNLTLRALNNISFEITKGEKVGLIGPNGSGKSTLLKCISGIYPPTTGEIKIIGEVGSLIDISAGIEPEADCLTNLRLLALARGLKMKQILEIEDQIIEFSELREHMGMQFKNLSTGMAMRLLFAVATTIIPDILIMDEIIGAGDEYFKNKAKNKITEIISSNRTLIIASHDLSILERICSRLMILNKGNIVYDGNVALGIKKIRNDNISIEN
jgi:lipopolysaccharide transport system ATP-binding protein